MYVKRTPRIRKPQYETAWAVFIIGIIFNYFTTAGKNLLNFSYGHIPYDRLISGMSGKLVLTLPDFMANFINQKLFLAISCFY